MRSLRSAAWAVLSICVCSPAFAQSYGLSVSNFQLVSSQTANQTKLNLTYRADIVNTGPAVASVTATVASLDPYSVRTLSGEDTLQFSQVPANGSSTSANTFTVQIDASSAFDPSKLQWTFLTSSGPVANAGPAQIATVGSQVTLNGTGSTNPSGVGTLTYFWQFASAPPGSTSFLSHSYTAMPTFFVDAPGNYVITLTVSNGVAASSANAMVSTSGANTPPVANAGPNQTAAVGSTAFLNGAGSTSAAGKPLSYAWTLLSRPSGSSAALSGANTVAPTFVVDRAGGYAAQLIVNDGLASAPSTVTVTTQTTAPVANPGPNQAVGTGALVQLNGSGSTDANGLPLTFRWNLISLPSGSGAVLSNSTAVNPAFTADLAGTYVAQLTVNNGTLTSVPATVTVTTQAALAPTANAGPNQMVNVGSAVTLNGSGTDPQGLPLTFQWSLLNKPLGSAAALSNASIANPGFVADVAGSYIAQLVVNDGSASSAPSTVTVGTACSQPIANPGPNQNVAVGDTVTLSGGGSADACRDQLTYVWSFISRPNGSTAGISGASTVAPSFAADTAGTYVLQLIVNNGSASSAPATVTVTAASASASGAGIVLPSGATVAPGQSIPFPVTLGTPAPVGGVFITLTSSDPLIATVSPTAIFIPQGASAASRAPVLAGINAGVATITAWAYNVTSTSVQVQVNSGPSMGFSPASLTINGTATQNLTLTLGQPAPANGLAVTLGSSNPGVAGVPASVSFGANTSSVAVPVTGVAGGSAIVTASAAGMPNATAGVTVVQTALAINLPGNTTVTVGQSATLALTLPVPAAAGGLTVLLASSDTSKVTVTQSVFIAGGATSPAAQPQVNGIGMGTANVSASAPSYTPGNAQVQVVPGGGSSFFSPGSATLNVGATQSLTLTLSAPAPGNGLTASLGSSNTGVASVPASVTFAAGASSVSVPVTGTAAGSATITANTPNFGSANASATVLALPPTPAGGPGVILPNNLTVAPGQSTPFQVALPTPAPSGGVFLTLLSGDPSIAAVAPDAVIIPQGFMVPNRALLLTGVGVGATTITALANGVPAASVPVQVISGASGSPTFSPASLAIVGTATQYLTLILPSPAPSGGMTVSLTSSNPSVASVPPTVSVGANAVSGMVPVTGVGAGSATIVASVTGLPNATAMLTVTQSGAISLPANTTVGMGQSVPLLVTLPTPAPAGGVTVSLVSGDTSKALVTPSVFITGGAFSPAALPQVNGINAGSVNITASASGYSAGSGQIQVVSTGGGSSFFSPGSVMVTAGGGQNLILYLSSPAGNGLTATLTSTNPGVAAALSSVTFLYGSATVNVPVTGVAPGSAAITATIPGYGSASAIVNVTPPVDPNVSITWYGGCWQYATIYGYSGNFQAIDFALTTTVPQVLEGTLFFAPNCDPSGGIDNMNDNGSTTGSTHMIQGFSHHPDEIPTSALYWLGPRTADGTCAPGAPCSGCVNYNKSTPSCGSLR